MKKLALWGLPGVLGLWLGSAAMVPGSAVAQAASTPAGDGPKAQSAASCPASALTVSDLDDRPVSLGSYEDKVVVLLHEDREASEQNQEFKTRLGKLSERYKGRLIVVALADVSAYDFWPARRYVKAALRRLRDEGAEVLCDWKGVFRKRFNLRKGESSLFLVVRQRREMKPQAKIETKIEAKPEAKIELAHQGILTPAQAAFLLEQIDREARSAAVVPDREARSAAVVPAREARSAPVVPAREARSAPVVPAREALSAAVIAREALSAAVIAREALSAAVIAREALSAAVVPDRLPDQHLGWQPR